MGFADKYLQKHAIRTGLINSSPERNLHCIVTIPAFNESGLTMCLDSLFKCEEPEFPTEIIVLVNIPEGADNKCIDTNKEIYLNALKWAEEHPKNKLRWHILYQENLPQKHFGAGLARKICMDEAVSRFNRIDNSEGIILSLDADTSVKENYLAALGEHFRAHPKSNACSIYFEHPLEGEEYENEVYKAICNYELHLRYYLNALRYTGYPYAYHTVGSAFAVKALTYVSEGGMSKRQAGEDFYFIQKVAMLGHFSECKTTCVFPSPRPSDRVPFGTGPDIVRQLEQKTPYYVTYDFYLFKVLKKFYSRKSSLFQEDNLSGFLLNQDKVLQDFLSENGFTVSIEEINANSASLENFNQRFLRKFNLFWILKFLHYAEEKGFIKTNILEAVKEFAQSSGIEISTNSTIQALKNFRDLENLVI